MVQAFLKEKKNFNVLKEIIPLDKRKRDIQGHKKFIQLSRSEVTTEDELILARAGECLWISCFCYFQV